MLRHTHLLLLSLLMTLNLCITSTGRALRKQKQMDSELKPYVGRVDAVALCGLMKCYSPTGSQCQVVKNGDILVPKCVCPITCPRQNAPLCSVLGKTYINECLLHKESCRKKQRIGKAHDGPCLEAGVCSDLELGQFPYRLLDWFLLISRMGKQYTAAHTTSCITNRHRVQLAQNWFSILDRNKNGKLSMKDLKKLHYKKMPLEHCANTFFKSCDKNRNNKVTVNEWISCLVDRSERWFNEYMSMKMGSRKLCDQRSSTDTENSSE
ncbi:SPARC-like protein 1 [Clarias gariepinus]|uniref:SPARC-like protein 1 n=1 Tax=Clarias gariepinus TaxID=13013 RepID=UPI00234D106E|nr:SPARC-like protein 1 [Clarias gariepinus]